MSNPLRPGVAGVVFAVTDRSRQAPLLRGQRPASTQCGTPRSGSVADHSRPTACRAVVLTKLLTSFAGAGSSWAGLVAQVSSFLRAR